MSIYNWSTDTRRLKKDKNQYTKWRLEQRINFGLRGTKLNASSLKKNLDKLAIDPFKKAFLKYILNV